MDYKGSKGVVLRIYHYVGQSELLKHLAEGSNRHLVTNAEMVTDWLQKFPQPKNPDNTITVTFIVDLDHQLWVNDRHSEHVLCANGGDILSAGEMTFEIEKGKLQIVDTTNQSTGYCPEPESYLAVKFALEKTDIAHLPQFTTAYQFRRCDECGTKNIVKDDWYVCGVCDADLSHEWNF